jgi:hypothetical protein
MTEIVQMLERRRQRRLTKATCWIAAGTVVFWLSACALVSWMVAR